MALQFNSFSKNGIITAMRAANLSGVFGTNASLRLFPTTVAFPSTPANTTGAVPSGHILSFTSLTFSMSGNSIIITSGTTAAQTSAAGTFGWWALVSSLSGNGAIISDSLTLIGNGGIVGVSTLTPTSGQSVSITFNLSVGA